MLTIQGSLPQFLSCWRISLFRLNADHDSVNLIQIENSPKMYNNCIRLSFCQLFDLVQLAASEPGFIVL